MTQIHAFPFCVYEQFGIMSLVKQKEQKMNKRTYYTIKFSQQNFKFLIVIKIIKTLKRSKKMQWKSDSIQQFIRYKLAHPDECLSQLQNYQQQKQQSQKLDKLDKELNKQRTQLNYFKHERSKLEIIVESDVEGNMQEMERVVKKIEEIKVKIQRVKDSKADGKSVADIKRQYEEVIRRENMALEQQEQRDRQRVQEARRQLDRVKNEKNQDIVKRQIQRLQLALSQQRQKNSHITQKKQLLSQLTQKSSTIKQRISLLSQQIASAKSQLSNQTTKQKQDQIQSINQSITKINTLKQSLLELFKSQGFITNSQPKTNSKASEEQELKVRQKVNEIIEENAKKYGIQFQVRVQALSHQQRSAMDYVASVIQASEKQQMQVELNRHTIQFDEIISLLKLNVQQIKQQSKAFFDQQNSTILQQETVLNKKQLQLDKEIKQLEMKVDRTQKEIVKITREIIR